MAVFLCIFTCHFIFLKSLLILPPFQKQHFPRITRTGVPQKEEKCHFSFSLIKRHFFMHFYVRFPFFKVPFDFFCLANTAFCKDKAHRGSLKRRKNVSSFFLESNGIFSCIFTCHFIYSNSLSIFPPFQNQHFAKLKCIRVPQKEDKCHFSFSLIEWHFFMHFYVLFHLFTVPFDFSAVPKVAFCKSKAHRGTPKGEKMSVIFFSNRTAFFHGFLRGI